MIIKGYEIKPFADLHGANLYGAYLRGADLYRANLSGAKGIKHFGRSSDGHDFYGVQSDKGVMIKAGCRWFTITEARKHWESTRKGTALGDERLKFVDQIEKWR